MKINLKNSSNRKLMIFLISMSILVPISIHLVFLASSVASTLYEAKQVIRPKKTYDLSHSKAMVHKTLIPTSISPHNSSIFPGSFDFRWLIGVLELLSLQTLWKDREIEKFVESSVQHHGSPESLHLAVFKAILKKSSKFRVGIIGGSTSVPHGVQPTQSYVKIFCVWLASRMTEVGVTVKCENKAIGSTASDFWSHCVEEYFDSLSNYDVFLLEFAINDLALANWKGPAYQPDSGRPMEELVRKLLARNPRLHIIIVVIPRFRELLDSKNPGEFCTKSPTVDTNYLEIAKRYNLTTIQVRHVVCKTLRYAISQPDVFKTKLTDLFVSNDRKHGNAKVHSYLAGFLIRNFQKIISQLKENVSKTMLFRSIESLEQSIKQQTNTLLSTENKKPVFASTRAGSHFSDCFIDTVCSSRHRVAFSTKTILRRQKRRLGREKSEKKIQNFAMNINCLSLKQPSKLCGHRGYIPRLAVVHSSLHRSSKAANLSVVVDFHFDNGVFVSLDFYRLVKPMQWHFYVQYLFASNTSTDSTVHPYFLKNHQLFCSKEAPAIENVKIALGTIPKEQKMMAAIVDYQCCRIKMDN